MSLILNIETSTSVCSVALSEGNNVLVFRELNELRSHSSTINIFIESVLKQAGFHFKDVDAIAVCKGPGSYTGLRIGVSTAKGLCYALGLPLIGIDTTLLLASGFLNDGELKKTVSSEYLFCPMIDARRMEVYTAIFTPRLEIVKDIDALIIQEDTFDFWLKQNQLYLFGNGAEKCQEVFKDKAGITIIEGFFSSARFMAPLSSQKFKNKEFEDVAYFEPYYLKEFTGKKNKNPV